jgi:hypothetical protein
MVIVDGAAASSVVFNLIRRINNADGVDQIQSSAARRRLERSGPRISSATSGSGDPCPMIVDTLRVPLTRGSKLVYPFALSFTRLVDPPARGIHTPRPGPLTRASRATRSALSHDHRGQVIAAPMTTGPGEHALAHSREEERLGELPFSPNRSGWACWMRPARSPRPHRETPEARPSPQRVGAETARTHSDDSAKSEGLWGFGPR